MKELKIKTEWVDTDKPEEDKPGCPWCGRYDDNGSSDAKQPRIHKWRNLWKRKLDEL